MRLVSWSIVLMLGSGLGAQAQQPYLVSDINQTEDVSGGYEPNHIAATSAAAYFLADFGFWRVDPSTTPVFLRSIRGLGGRELVAVGDDLYFDDNVPGLGTRLFRSDGTPAGTALVPGSPRDPRELTNVAGTLFFVAPTGPLATSELWRSDGTAPGTGLVSSSGGDFLTAAGSRLFFVRSEPATGTEVWTSDGTALGTHIVRDVCPGSCTGVDHQAGLAVVGGVLYFSGNDGLHGRELWRSDGTAAGTSMVLDALPVVAGPPAGPAHLTSFGSLVLFSAETQPPTLWRTDGSAAGTFVLQAGLVVDSIHAADGLAFVAGDDGVSGRELWRTNGLAGGTVRLTDGCPGPCDFLDVAPLFANTAGGTVFTSATDTGTQLWRSDGTAAGTVPIASFEEVLPVVPARFGPGTYFVANDGTHGPELWRTDGTAPGTVLATDASDSSSLPEFGFTSGASAAGDRLYFAAFRPDIGQELWTTTGTSGSTVPLEIVPGPAPGYVAHGAALGGAFLFSGRLETGFFGLFRTEGTLASTQVIAPVQVTADMGVRDGLAYFGGGPTPEGPELWRSDGTAAGTHLLKEIVPGSSGSGPGDFVRLGDAMLFRVGQDHEGHPFTLWRTDGTTDGTFRILDRGCGSLTRAGTRVFLRCGPGPELWVSDGTASGTRLVTNLPGSTYNEPTAVEDTLFFNAESTFDVLWKSDGTTAGTVPVQDGVGGPLALDPTSLTASGGLLFFIASRPETGSELWRSDGTSAGTQLVRDIFPGPDSGMYYGTGELAAVPGGVVFRVVTTAAGDELWFSDGTEAGTVPYDEIEPGPGSSYPRGFRVAGSRVYFKARQTPIDDELWAVDFPAAATVADAHVRETDSGTTTASFAVALTAAAPGPVTVAFTTVAGTAQAGSDFQAVSGVITFPPATTGPQIVSVPVSGDLQDEPDETFTLRLTSVVGALTADGRAEGVIADDDGPTVAIVGATVLEGDAGTTPAVVTATLTTKDGAPTPTAKTIGFATEGGTAAPGSDFDAQSGTVTFAAGTTSGSAAPVAVQVRGDALDEPDEVFTVRFQPNGDETVPSPVVTVHIRDDDGVDAAAPTEIAPGSVLRADLAPPAGRVSDRDYYLLLQQPQASYEVVIDETSGDAAPLTLVRVAGSTVLQTAGAVGTGGAVSLRWENTSSSAVIDGHLAVSSASCGTGCGADDRYRLRAYETTLSAPRFNNVNGQGTVVVLQNTTSDPISGRLLLWQPSGFLGLVEPFTVPGRGTVAINTLALYPASGTVTVTHDGPYGALAGKAVALEPATGFSFDTPLTSRPR
jgi:ELWxxDGT repeat protein